MCLREVEESERQVPMSEGEVAESEREVTGILDAGAHPGGVCQGTIILWYDFLIPLPHTYEPHMELSWRSLSRYVSAP